MLDTNRLPIYDKSDNATGCCPRFQPAGWDGVELQFRDKLFLKATTRCILHVPINMGSVFPRTFADIEAAQALADDQFIVLSDDRSPWAADHYFSVTREVPGHEMVLLSGVFITRVFEGPYKNVRHWCKEMPAYAKERGREVKKTYFFYTTCPKCSKVYGKNYVVAVSEVR